MPGSTPATLNPTVAKVTQRIRERSAERRALYERRMADQHVDTGADHDADPVGRQKPGAQSFGKSVRRQNS